MARLLTWDNVRTWLLTGAGPLVTAGIDVAPGDLGAHDAANTHRTWTRTRLLALTLLLFNLAFWLTDDWLLGHLPGLQPALDHGRLVITLGAGSMVLLTTLVRPLSPPVAWIVLMLILGAVAYALARLGGPGSAWFSPIHLFAFFPLGTWLRPLVRSVITIALAAVMVTCIFAGVPAHQTDAMAGSFIGFLAFAVSLSMLLGAYLDRLRLRLFLFARAADRQAETLAARVDAQTARIQRLLDHVESARDDERRELAAELHDEMGQLLTAMRLVIKVARGRAAAGEQVGDDLARLGDLQEQVNWSIRNLLARLRPPVLDDLGLAAAVEWLVQRVEPLPDVTAHLSAGPALESLPLSDARADVGYRVVQEALTNAVRHADAQRIDVALHTVGPHLRIAVSDDGRGFDPERTPRGMGLMGMNERVRSVDGRLEIVSAPARGTRITAWLPLDAPESSP